MKDSAHLLDIVTRILATCLRAAGIVCFIFSVLVLAFGDKMISETYITLDFLQIYPASSLPIHSLYMRLFAIVGLVFIGILCFLASHAAKILRQILDPIMDGRPFEADTPKHLQKIAWIVLICGGVSQIMKLAESLIMTKAFPLEQIISSDAVSRIEYAFSMDFGFVVFFFILMFLSYIFSYGQMLQKESVCWHLHNWEIINF